MHSHSTLAAILALGAVAAPQAAAAQQISLHDWSQQAYDPDYEPRTDPRNELFDADYDPRTDENHPMRQDKDPGEKWDSPRRADGTPSIRRAMGDWDWGELVYGRTYNTKLTLTNQCASAETVTITKVDLPYLTAPEKVTIPGKSSVELALSIVTPPPPNITFLTGHENIPEGGIFVDITGDSEMLKVWHPWNGDCLPKRETYKVTGHIHYDDADTDKDPGPQRLATVGPCRVWWNTGERPAQAEKDCTLEFRTFALHYREKVIQGFASRDPAAWAWLPVSGEIREMTAAALLAMKQRADAQAREA